LTEPRFDHPALLYRDAAEYLAGTTAFVRSALDADQPVLVAVPGVNLRVLRDALSDAGDRIAYADMAEAGRNPGRIIPGILLKFADDHPGRRVSVVGEPVWPGRTPLEYPACAAHEALINVALADRDAEILCTYDAVRLDPGAVADARRTHPEVIDDGCRSVSRHYRDPLRSAADFSVPLPEPPAGAASMRYDTGADLSGVRDFVGWHAGAVLPAARVCELVLAAHELVANTVRHTDGGGRITVWAERGLLACQVDDGGHITDPLLGRMPPSLWHPSGRGLLLVNQICDLVRIHSVPGGTSIRIQMSTSGG
jgi:anti-sigma regulatory factor (Ser/Thr protein kinase)